MQPRRSVMVRAGDTLSSGYRDISLTVDLYTPINQNYPSLSGRYLSRHRRRLVTFLYIYYRRDHYWYQDCKAGSR